MAYTEWKVGDRFQVVGGFSQNIEGGYEGKVGEILGKREVPHSKFRYHVRFDDGREVSEWSDASDMKLIKSPMQQLNSMMKRLLDSNAQKLYKAGFINGDLELTDEGKNALWGIIFEQNKEALVSFAEEVIAEEEKK